MRGSGRKWEWSRTWVSPFLLDDSSRWVEVTETWKRRRDPISKIILNWWPSCPSLPLRGTAGEGGLKIAMHAKRPPSSHLPQQCDFIGVSIRKTYTNAVGGVKNLPPLPGGDCEGHWIPGRGGEVSIHFNKVLPATLSHDVTLFDLR